MARRMTYSEQAVMRVLREHPTRAVSYDHIAAAAEIDTRTAQRSIARLQQRQKLQIERGRGCRPNQYLLM